MVPRCLATDPVARMTDVPTGKIRFCIRRGPSRRTPARLRLEGLEGRCLLSITEFTIPIAGSAPESITAGPDGNLWFADIGASAIGMIDPITDVISEFPTPTPNSAPFGITAGPDGNLWFTELSYLVNKIGEINPKTRAISEFSLPANSVNPSSITAGPDENLWFTTNNNGNPQIGEINPTTHAISVFAITDGSQDPTGITAGPDGKVWFTEEVPARIGVIDPTTHIISAFALPSDGSKPSSIVAGPDGNLWFTEFSGDAVGMIDPTTHAIREFGLAHDSSPSDIAVGPDGNLWFAESGSAGAVPSKIGMIDPKTDAITEFPIPYNNADSEWITAGPDGNIWFTDYGTDAIGVVTLNASHFVVTQQPPSSITAGTSFGLVVEADDSSGHLDSSFDGTVTVALGNNPGGAMLGGTLTVAATNGVATFSGLTLTRAASGYTLVVSSSGVDGATTNPFTITPAAPSQLVVTQQPPSSVIVDHAFGLQATIEDAYGNVDTNDNAIVAVALANNPTRATLGGTLSVTPSQGVSTFTGLSLNAVGTGYTLQVSSGSLTATTTAFDVVAAPSSQLVVMTQPPASVVAGAGFGLIVEAEDQYGTVMTSFDGSVTIALASNPGNSTLGGSLSVTAVNGIATFVGLTLDRTDTGYTIEASSGSLTAATTAGFTVTPAAAQQLAIATEPPSSITVDARFGLTLLAEDRFGNQVTSFTGSVTASLANNPGGSTLGGTLTVVAVDGVATFSDLTLNQAGSGYALAVGSGSLTAATTTAIAVALPAGYTPLQIQTAYGIGQLQFGSASGDGRGQTIAIIDAYDDPTLQADLDAFDELFGLTSSGPSLYAQYGPASSFLTVLNQSGQASPRPATDPSGNWEVEEALDVEWAHAIAPEARLILVEANSQRLSDLMASVPTAASQPGVSVVSMSWGFTEGQDVLASDEARYDRSFSTPGVTFVASTGDAGAYNPGYPAFSPNVLAVGGTTLQLNADNTYRSETGWSFSGGGTSHYETPEPAYQQGVQNTGYRTIPDVAFDADPITGVPVFDSFESGGAPWIKAGGTSLAAPCWAALIAIANQGRVAQHGQTLDGASQTLPALYSLPESDFHHDLGGSNGTTDTGLLNNARYDEITGLGSPIADLLIPDLVAYQMASQLVVAAQPSSSVMAGSGIGLTIKIEDRSGNIVPSFAGSVTIALANHPGGSTLGGTLTVTAVNGIAVFSGLTLTRATSGYTLQVSSSGLSDVTTSAITVNPAAASQAAITQQPPASLTAGSPFGLRATIEDPYGNLETDDSGSVVVTLARGPTGATLGGTLSVAASRGVATFADLTLTRAASGYTLEVSRDGLSGATTAAITVTPAAPAKLVPTMTRGSLTAGADFGLTIAIEDTYGNLSSPRGNDSITIAIASGPSGASMSGQTVATASGGVATFAGLTITRVGSYTFQASGGGLPPVPIGPIVVTAAAPAQLIVMTPPPSTITAGAGFGLAVSAEDAYGNPTALFGNVVTITATDTSGSGSLGGPTTASPSIGVASFSGLLLDSAGTYTLQVSSVGLGPITAGTLEVSPAQASQLILLTQPPTTISAGAGFGLQVEAKDPYGNLATGFHGFLTADLVTNAGGATLTGSVTAVADQGIATFAGLAMDRAGSSDTIQVTASGLPSVTTASFDVAPAAASQLVISVEPPARITAGDPFGFSVAAVDAYGNPVTSYSGKVTIALGKGAGPGALDGTATTAMRGGVATFSGLTLDTAGSGDTIAATSGGLIGAATTAIDVVPAAPASLVMTIPPPTTMTAGAGFGLAVAAEDRYGNLTTGLTGVVTIALANDLTGATLAGPLTATAANGVANFAPRITLDTAGAGYTIRATADGLAPITMGPITVVPGPATHLVVLTQPPSTPAPGAGFGLVVAAEDAFGNVDPNYAGRVHIGQASGSSTALGGTATVTASHGVATFAGLTLSGASSPVSLQVTGAGLTGTSTVPIVSSTSNAGSGSSAGGGPGSPSPSGTGGGPVVSLAPLVTMTGVRVVRNRRGRISEIVIGLSGAPDPAEADNTAEYHLIAAGRRGSFVGRGVKAISLRSAFYDPAKDTVVLIPRRPFVLRKPVGLALDFVRGPLFVLRGRSTRMV